jgi:hypothetical protein
MKYKVIIKIMTIAILGFIVIGTPSCSKDIRSEMVGEWKISNIKSSSETFKILIISYNSSKKIFYWSIKTTEKDEGAKLFNDIYGEKSELTVKDNVMQGSRTIPFVGVQNMKIYKSDNSWFMDMISPRDKSVDKVGLTKIK